MFSYFLTFLVLLLASMAFYLLYERFSKPQNKGGSELYQDALIDLLDGRKEAAFNKLRQVVNDNPDNIDAYLRLGKILLDYKKPQQALQIHKDLTLRTGLIPETKADILRHLYQDYIALENEDMAQAALTEITKLLPRNRWAFVKLLELQKQQSKWDEAYETAVVLLKIEENKSKKPLASFKYNMGMELYKKREYHKARILFKEAIGFDPKYVDAYLSIGDSYNKEERFEDAVNFWNKLISTVPEKGHLVIERLKKTLFDLGRYGELEGICEKILNHAPRNYEARVCLAEFYAKKGESQKAEEQLKNLFEDYPEDMRVLVELLMIYLEQNDTVRIENILKTIEHKHLRQNNQVVS